MANATETTPTADPPALPGWPACLTKEQLASYIGMSPRWCDAALATGELPKPIRFGRAVRWRRSDIDVWLAARDTR